MDDGLEGKIFEEKLKKIFTTPLGALGELIKRKIGIGHYCHECYRTIRKVAFTSETLKMLERYYDCEECAIKGKEKYIHEMNPAKIGVGFLKDYAKESIKRIESEQILKLPINEIKNNNP